MAVDRHVVGRIGKQHLGFFATQQLGKAFAPKSIATQNAVLVTNPEVTRTGHRRGKSVNQGQRVFLTDAAIAEQNIDLAHLEAAEFKIGLRGKLQNFRELQRELLRLPRRILAEPIERQPQGPQFGLGQLREGAGRHLGKTQLACGQHQPPPRYDSPLRVDQDRQHETEPIETGGELADLSGRVPPGLAPQRLAVGDRNQPGVEITRDGVAIPAPL
jgi:hypothetical protein